ncbi:MAG: hypothetical protein ACI81V_000337, partial [Lentimonas sp.]
LNETAMCSTAAEIRYACTCWSYRSPSNGMFYPGTNSSAMTVFKANTAKTPTVNRDSKRNIELELFRSLTYPPQVNTR